MNEASGSRFRIGLRATRGLRWKLVEIPTIESLDVVTMTERLNAGLTYLGVQFTGYPPKKERAITVKVQDAPFAFPIDEIGWLCLPAESYTVVVYRGGAIKASAVHLVAGEAMLVRFRFSRLGITWSRWGAAEASTAQTLGRLVAGDHQP